MNFLQKMRNHHIGELQSLRDVRSPAPASTEAPSCRDKVVIAILFRFHYYKPEVRHDCNFHSLWRVGSPAEVGVAGAESTEVTVPLHSYIIQATASLSSPPLKRAKNNFLAKAL